MQDDERRWMPRAATGLGSEPRERGVVGWMLILLAILVAFGLVNAIVLR